jgi:hypothetical protein
MKIGVLLVHSLAAMAILTAAGSSRAAIGEAVSYPHDMQSGCPESNPVPLELLASGRDPGFWTRDTESWYRNLASDLARQGWSGIEVRPSSDPSRIPVVRVVSGSPAELAGLKEGDTILTGAAALSTLRPGARLSLSVERQGRDSRLSLTLRAIPARVICLILDDYMRTQTWLGSEEFIVAMAGHPLDTVDVASAITRPGKLPGLGLDPWGGASRSHRGIGKLRARAHEKPEAPPR